MCELDMIQLSVKFRKYFLILGVRDAYCKLYSISQVEYLLIRQPTTAVLFYYYVNDIPKDTTVSFDFNNCLNANKKG